MVSGGFLNARLLSQSLEFPESERYVKVSGHKSG